MNNIPGEFFNLSEGAQRKIAELLANPPKPSERLKAAYNRCTNTDDIDRFPVNTNKTQLNNQR